MPDDFIQPQYMVWFNAIGIVCAVAFVGLAIFGLATLLKNTDRRK